MLFQYQAGPRSSYFDISSSENAFEGAKLGGSWMTGVAGSSGTVKSTTRTPPPASALTSCDRTLLGMAYALAARELTPEVFGNITSTRGPRAGSAGDRSGK